jgi:hypothetical protein
MTAPLTLLNPTTTSPINANLAIPNAQTKKNAGIVTIDGKNYGVKLEQSNDPKSNSRTNIVLVDPSIGASGKEIFKTPGGLSDIREVIEKFKGRQSTSAGSDQTNAQDLKNLVKKDSNGTFVIDTNKLDPSKLEQSATLIAQAIRLNGGVGEYFAIGADLPQLATSGFSTILGMAMRKLGVPPQAIAAAEKFFNDMAAKGKLLGGSIGNVPRFEFNCSMLPDAAAQEASGNFHIKFSPIPHTKLATEILRYKTMAAAIPGGEIVVGLLSELQRQLDRTGKLKPGTRPLITAIYNSLVVDITPPKVIDPPKSLSNATNYLPPVRLTQQNKPTAGTSLAPLPSYTSGKLGLFDTRISFNWYKSFVSKKDPDIRFGRMFVAVGNLERLNESLGTKQNLLKYVKILGAPYISPRVGLDGSLQLVFGFGGLAVPSTQATKTWQQNKPFVFPGFYVAAKLTFKPNDSFVRVDADRIAVRLNVNGSPKLVVLPNQVVNAVLGQLGLTNQQVKLSSVKATDRVIDGSEIFKNLLSSIDPKLLDSAKQTVEKSQQIIGPLLSPELADAGTIVAGLFGFKAGPVAGVLSSVAAMSEVAWNKYEREFEKFNNGLLTRLATGNPPPTLLADITRSYEQLTKVYNDVVAKKEFDFRSSPAVQMRRAIATLGIFYNKSIQKAASAGSLPGGITGFYKELIQVAQTSPNGSIASIVAKTFLGDKLPDSGAGDTAENLIRKNLMPPAEAKFFNYFRIIDQFKNSPVNEFTTKQVSDLMSTGNSKVVREVIDYYIQKKGDPQRLVAQLGILWQQAVKAGKDTPALYETFCNAISNPATRSFVILNNAMFSGDVADLKNQNRLYDFSKIDGAQTVTSPVAFAEYMKKIGGELLARSSLRTEQIRNKNPSYAGQKPDAEIPIGGGITAPAPLIKYWDSIAYALVVNLGVDFNFGNPFLAKRIANLKNAINGKQFSPLSSDVARDLPNIRKQFSGTWKPSGDYEVIKRALNN